MSKILYVLAIVCMIWVIYDVWAKNTSLKDGQKLLWTVLAFFFSIITAIVYYLTQKK